MADVPTTYDMDCIECGEAIPLAHVEGNCSRLEGDCCGLHYVGATWHQHVAVYDRRAQITGVET